MSSAERALVRSELKLGQGNLRFELELEVTAVALSGQAVHLPVARRLRNVLSEAIHVTAPNVIHQILRIGL